MRFIILSALLSVASIVCVTAQSSGTVGYNRTTLNTAPTNLNYRAATVTSKITNASIYGITGILKGDGIGGSVLATPGVDYEPAGGGGGTTVSVNGTAVSTPNFTNSATATFSVATTNVSVNPTNLANAQIAAGAAIDFSKLSGVAALVHTHAGEDITSGTVAAARIDSAIATDAEVSAAVANVIHSNVAGEIAAITDKATPVAADHLLIEDSADSDAKKDITIASLETALEGLLDFGDLQGVPSGILVNPDSDNSLAGEVPIFAGTTRTNLIPGSQSTNTTILLHSKANDGTTAVVLNAGTTHTSGSLAAIQNNGTNMIYYPVSDTGHAAIYQGPSALDWFGQPEGEVLISYYDLADGEPYYVEIDGIAEDSATGALGWYKLDVESLQNGQSRFWVKKSDGNLSVDSQWQMTLASGTFDTAYWRMVYTVGGGPETNLFRFWPTVTTAGVPNYLLNTFTNRTAGSLLKVQNYNTDKFDVDWAGNIIFAGGTLSTPANFTLWDGSQASRTWTASLSGATDPVWTYGNNSADLTTGVLKYGGNTVATLTGSETLANKTLTTPVIADFSNATHNHQNNAGGGALSASAITSGTLSGDRIASGNVYRGYVPTPWVQTDNSAVVTWKKTPEVCEMLNGTQLPWAALTVGGSVSSGVAGDGVDFGWWQGSTSTSGTGVGGFRTDTGGGFFSTNSVALHLRVRTSASLSDGSESYELVAGFGDTTTSALPVDGAFFFYTHTTNSGAWVGVTAANSVMTAATGGATVTVAVNTTYDLKVEANSSSVNFFVSSNYGTTWQYIGTSSSNIPNTSARVFGLTFYIKKTNGTTARTFNLGRSEYWPQL